jgi:endogenous inhibitor of DNA gyrase (YacG/DUF329 family)
MIDLGHWLSESYKVPSKEKINELEENNEEIESESEHNESEDQGDY